MNINDVYYNYHTSLIFMNTWLVGVHGDPVKEQELV